jgi:hypothetical protein
MRIAGGRSDEGRRKGIELASGISGFRGLVRWGRSLGRAGRRGAIGATAEGGMGAASRGSPFAAKCECEVKFTERMQAVRFSDGTRFSAIPYVSMKEAVASGQ